MKDTYQYPTVTLYPFCVEHGYVGTGETAVDSDTTDLKYEYGGDAW